MSGMQDVARAAGLKTEIVANLFESILHAVANGEKVRIKGFGTFERRLYKGRTLTTPAVNEGEPIKYPDSYVLKFHQSQLAKRRINIVAKKQKQDAPEPAKVAKKKSKVHPEEDAGSLKAKKSKTAPPPPEAAKKPKKKPKAAESDEE